MIHFVAHKLYNERRKIMKIPSAISLASNQSSAPSSKMPDEIWLSVPEAAALLKVKPSTVLKRIRKGTLEGKRSEDMPFTFDGEENFLVLLKSLPEKAQYQYHVSRLDEHVSVDLASPRSKFGDHWIGQFINIAQLLRDAAEIRSHYRGTGRIKEHLTQLAQAHGISLSTLYRFSAQPQPREISLLYTDPAYLQYKLPKTMCLWSCDLAFALYLAKKKHYSQNEILKELKDNAKTSCNECPYSPKASDNPDNDNIGVTCTRCNGTMIVPKNRKVVNRLLSHVPSSLHCLAKDGYRQWRAKYGLFVTRDKPIFVNEAFSADNHVCDIFVRVKIKRTKNDKTYEKEIAVRPVLTVWMDSASSYIVGWAISVIPNSDTIAEAFARACVYTVGDIACGLPKTVIIDQGKDYKSKLLADPCSKYSIENWDEPFLNKRFAGTGLFQALGCNVQDCIPYSPQSKSAVERFFRIIEEKYISKMCGWCHNSVAERPVDFAKTLKKLLEEKKLLTFEEFVDYFQNTILPDYHTSALDPDDVADLAEEGYIPSFASMSPAQRYKSLEKARNVVPDWKTMSILMRHYKPDATEIKQYGVLFAGVYYKHDKLNEYSGQRASILYHAFNKPFAPESIIVLVEGKAICEAFPSYRNKLTGESQARLDEDRRVQNAPAIKLRKTLERIGKSVHNILPADVESHEMSEKEQLQEFSFAPMITAQTSDSALPANSVIPAAPAAPAYTPEEAVDTAVDTLDEMSRTAEPAAPSTNRRRKLEKEIADAQDFLFGRFDD